MFSGGMDSTIALYHALDVARKNGGRVHALSFSYGQRHSNELGHARTIMGMIAHSERYSAVLGNYVTHKLHFPAIHGSLLGGDPVMKYRDVEQAESSAFMDNSFVPYRNLIFFSTAALYAHQWNCSLISSGLRGGFPDCTQEFEQVVQAAINYANPDHHIRIDTPTHMSREDCIVLATTIPGCMEALQYTLTCFEGTTPPCGQCLPCLKRAQGFAKTGMHDPLTGPRHRGMPPFDA